MHLGSCPLWRLPFLYLSPTVYLSDNFAVLKAATGPWGIFRDFKKTATDSWYSVAYTPTKRQFDSRRRNRRVVTGAADPHRAAAMNDKNGGSVLHELCRRVSLPAFENIIKGFADCLLQFLLDLGLYRLFCGGLLSFHLPLLPHCAVHGFHDLLRCVAVQVHVWVVFGKGLVVVV